MSNEHQDAYDDEVDVTDNGFGSVVDRLRMGDYNDVQAKELIEKAQRLAGDNFDQLVELRRTLLSLFGGRIGDENRVVLPFVNGAGRKECLFI